MSNDLKNQPGRSEKRHMQTTQLIFHNLAEIVELYPQYKVAQHLCTILRRKDTEGKQPIHWTDDELLKRIEQHKTELEGDQFMNEVDEDY